MLDPTEGVPHSRVGKSFLKRNLAKDVDVNTILSDDRQELRIDVTTYRIFFTYNGISGRPFVYQKQMSQNERAHVEEALVKEKGRRNEKMKEKFVMNTAWMKDQGTEEVEHRITAWQKGLQEGLWKMEETLKALPAASAASGDAMAVDKVV